MTRFSCMAVVAAFLALAALAGCGGSSGDSGGTLDNARVIGVLDGPLKDGLNAEYDLRPYGGLAAPGPLLVAGSEIDFLTEAQKAYIRACHNAGFPVLLVEVANSRAKVIHDLLDTGLEYDSETPKFLWYGFHKQESGVVKLGIGYYPDEMMEVQPCIGEDCALAEANATYQECVRYLVDNGYAPDDTIYRKDSGYVEPFDYDDEIKASNVGDMGAWVAARHAAFVQAADQGKAVQAKSDELKSLSDVALQYDITTLFTGLDGKKYQVITSVVSCRSFPSGKAYYLFEQQLSLNLAPGTTRTPVVDLWVCKVENLESVAHSFDINTYPLNEDGDTATDVYVEKYSPQGTVSTVSYNDSFTMNVGGKVGLDSMGISLGLDAGIKITNSITCDVPEVSITSHAIDNDQRNQLRWVYDFPRLEAEGVICAKYGDIRNVHNSTSKYEQSWIWSAESGSDFEGRIRMDVAAMAYDPAVLWTTLFDCALPFFNANLTTTTHNATLKFKAPPTEEPETQEAQQP